MLLSVQTTQALTDAAGAASESQFDNVTAAVFFVVVMFAALLCSIYIFSRNRQGKRTELHTAPENGESADGALTRRSTVSVILVACDGYMNGRMFTFKRELLIGRDSSVCTVVYPQSVTGISGTHCRLYVQSGGVFLADLNSASGTYLENGESIAPRFPVRLTAGMKFYVGSPENMFEVRL